MDGVAELSAKAKACYESGNLEDALNCCRRVLELQGEAAEGLNDLGAVYFKLAQPRLSERCFARALKLGGGQSEAAQNLDMLCRATGATLEAAMNRVGPELPAPLPPVSRDMSVVVPVHGVSESLDKCMEALCGQTLGPERYEVLVVANGLSEAAQGELSALLAGWEQHLGRRLRLLRVEEASIPLARNEGIGHAAGRVVLQINADTLLSRTALARHYAEHEGFGFDPRFVVAGGRKFPESYRRRLFNYLYEEIPLYTPLHRPGQRFLADASWFVTCNLSCMREAYGLFGVYDPIFAWGSDVALGTRWEEKFGMQLYVNTHIVSYHLHELSFDFWKNKLVEAIPYWFRRGTGKTPEQLSVQEQQVVKDRLDARILDVVEFEEDIHRLEAAFSGPESFRPQVVMGRSAPTLRDFVWHLRAQLKCYRLELQHAEIWKRIERGKSVAQQPQDHRGEALDRVTSWAAAHIGVAQG